MGTTFVTLYTELGNRLNDTSHGLWTLARKKSFINSAIDMWYQMGGRSEVIDESVTTDTTSVEYTLASGIPNAASIIEVTLEQDSGEPYARITDKNPRFVDSEGSLPTTASSVKMYIDEAFDTANKKIRVRYMTSYSTSLSTDAQITNVPAEAIYLYASYLAHNERANNVSMALRDFHRQERDSALAMYMNLIDRMIRKRPKHQIEAMGSDW